MRMDQPFFPVHGNFVNDQLYALGRTERGKGVSDAFLAGYQSVRRLSPAELDALGSFVMLRQIWLLGIGAKNMPNFGLDPFQEWCFNQCMPIIRAWMEEPWY
jgi:Ser/Thr protein kinase RdoA (MazF antagonist)